MQDSILPPMNELVLENNRRTSHLRTAAVLSLASGSAMVVSGVTSHTLIIDTLHNGAGSGFVVDSVAGLISSFLILSGVFFVVGGVMLVYKHYSFGRPLVALAGGLGIFTLAFCVVLAYLGSSFSLSASLSSYPEYFLGILLACGSTAIELGTERAW